MPHTLLNLDSICLLVAVLAIKVVAIFCTHNDSSFSDLAITEKYFLNKAN